MEYEVGKKFVWKPINRATKKREVGHYHYGKVVTIIKVETLDRLLVSIDDFPEMNWRESKNRFMADKDELEEIQ